MRDGGRAGTLLVYCEVLAPENSPADDSESEAFWRVQAIIHQERAPGLPPDLLQVRAKSLSARAGLSIGGEALLYAAR